VTDFSQAKQKNKMQGDKKQNKFFMRCKINAGDSIFQIRDESSECSSAKINTVFGNYRKPGHCNIGTLIKENSPDHINQGCFLNKPTNLLFLLSAWGGL
jgi:hypothetical protein